jgi:hypothetical protein
MPATLEILEQRLVALEREMAALRQLLLKPAIEETSAERGARLIRQAQLGQAPLAAGWAKAMQQMGIQGEPIGAEKVQEMIAACGFKAENNEFSRGIIEMREE